LRAEAMERFAARSISTMSLRCSAIRRRSAVTSFRRGLTEALTSFRAKRRISPFNTPAKFGTMTSG
jgi:hypothetical protein